MGQFIFQNPDAPYASILQSHPPRERNAQINPTAHKLHSFAMLWNVRKLAAGLETQI